jgi:hypothetical protein
MKTISWERCRNSERDKTLTGVEWETWNTFDLTIKNVPRLIKFPFKNKIYNYFIFKESLYSLIYENEWNEPPKSFWLDQVHEFLPRGVFLSKFPEVHLGITNSAPKVEIVVKGYKQNKSMEWLSINKVMHL